ncbi:hypothetical protein ACFL6Y_01120 [Elusimicrobiota bacterium]
MEHSSIHTLQEFLLHTEAVMYVVAVMILIGFIWFYGALTSNEEN